MAWLVLAPMIANRHVEQKDVRVKGEIAFPLFWEEVSSLAADASLPPRPSSAGLFEVVTELSLEMLNMAL
jgi:hypothetical protein